jgi:hypothetical protein
MKNVRTPLKKYLRLLLAPGMLLLFLSSCIKDNNNYVAPPVAYLSFVQASTDEPPISFYLNSDLVNNYQPILYGNHFGYINAYAGARTANFDNAYTGAQLLSQSITLNQNTYYTLFLANTATSPQTLLLLDSLNKPNQGEATIRFVNLSPDAGPVDLVAKGTTTTTIANKPFLGYSASINVPAGAYQLQVNATGTSTALATMTTITLGPGGVYTVWLYGLKNNTTPADVATIGVMTNALYD